jgi:hypothetical protein
MVNLKARFYGRVRKSLEMISFSAEWSRGDDKVKLRHAMGEKSLTEERFRFNFERTTILYQ